MRCRTPIAPILFALLVPAAAHGAWATDPYSGNTLVTAATGTESTTRMVSDGAGGCIVVWVTTNGSGDIYAQRFDHDGDPLWTPNGVPVVTAAASQSSIEVAPDGAGGVIVAWLDERTPANLTDVYAQRILANGTRAWDTSGVVVCANSGDQFSVQVVSDGAGGGIFVWGDPRNGNYDLYAQRINASGSAVWVADGVVVTTAIDSQFDHRIAPNGSGGVFVVWEDFRSGTNFDIYGQSLSATGAVQWLSGGRALCTLAGDQRDVGVLADGTGGAYVVWADRRNGADYDIYGLRTTSVGLPVWTSSGIAVCAQADDQFNPVICPDGTGGFFVTWEDERNTAGVSDVYAQRVAPGGNAVWNTAAVSVATSPGDQFQLALAPDGAGGALLCWVDERANPVDEIYAVRLSPSGLNLWTSGGVLVSNGFGARFWPRIVADGDAGALIVWDDTRGPAGDSPRLQRVERYGFLGDPAPAITAVGDVPNDQGGSVKVTWNRSHLDADPLFGIAEYRVFRSVPGGALSAMRARRAVTEDSDVAAATGALLVRPGAGTQTGWEFVGTQTAEGLPSYSRVVATPGDSVPGSNPWTLFMVEARAGVTVNADRWFSAPDSGYSVDNLAPAMPAPFGGEYAAGTTALHWNPNSEPDLGGYRLYRGTSVAFVPGPANLVTAQPDTGYVDAAGVPFVYKLTAVDFHGNESPVATLIPDGTVAVGGADAPRAYLVLAGEQPVRGTATLRFGLGSSGHTTLALYDLGGRRVRALVSGSLEPGDHLAIWDGRDAEGRAVPAGLYFARLEAPGVSATARVVRVR